MLGMKCYLLYIFQQLTCRCCIWEDLKKGKVASVGTYQELAEFRSLFRNLIGMAVFKFYHNIGRG